MVQKVRAQEGRLAALLKSSKAEPERVEELFLATLCRPPSSAELAVVQQTFAEAENKDEAFDLLRIVSQRTHRKLADIAGHVAETGELPDIPHAR